MPPLAGASLKALAGHRVAVALSGGADSVALTLWLHAHQDRPPHHVTLAGLIHVNHQLRGAESDRDEAFCRALAGRLGVPIDVIMAPIAGRGGRSPESAARAARYRAFDAAASRLGATRVVTAHTADDQAETVLMRLLRGTGSRGLSGIRAERGQYVRPFLACRRPDVRAWLQSRGEACCEDSTNADRSVARNRVRHDLLPVIEQVAPGGIAALARAAALAADDEEVLQKLAVESASAVVLTADTGARGLETQAALRERVRGLETQAALREPAALRAGAVDLDRNQLRALAPAIARRVLRHGLERLAPHAPWRADHFEAVRRLAARRAGGGSLDLPGVRVERVSNVVRLRPAMTEPVRAFAYTLTLPGEVVVVEAGLVVSASEGAVEAYSLQVPAAAFPLVVRNRRPGDRVALSGGTRKVQDLLVDAKIPRSERDRVLLVVASDGRILGVIGPTNVGVAAAGTGAVDMVVLSIRKLELT